MRELSSDDREGIRVLRHSARTHLNHIQGYAQILREEAEEAGLSELCESYERLSRMSAALRDVLIPCLREPLPGGGDLKDRGEREKEAYGILYDIIAMIQETKRRIGTDSRFLPDTERILEGANAVVGILEDGLKEISSDADRILVLPPEESEPSEASLHGRILVVDDDSFNREFLARHLERQGHVVCLASDGSKALELLREAPFDLLIIDVMMPGMNGYQLLERIRSDENLSGIHVIVISALDDTQSIARCIQLGAEDYLPREFEPIVLKARIESCLEKKRLKEKEAVYVKAVRETERRLRAELKEGAAYVRSLLPKRLVGPEISSDWVFIPSLSLGGDVFGYHAIGAARERRLVLYLLDVSGHGIEAALYSVTLMNLLKSQSLPGADFGDPASVLRRLNASFRMEEQNNLYFTAWYGVWTPATRELVFSSAGGPPALLVPPEGEAERLGTEGMIAGIEEGAVYENGKRLIPEGSSLYLFSDGAYEVRLSEGGVLGLDAFCAALAEGSRKGPRPLLAPLAEELRALSTTGHFEDDVSLLEFRFGLKDSNAC